MEPAFTCPTCKQPFQSRDLHLAFNSACRDAAAQQMTQVLEFRRGIHLASTENGTEKPSA
jgi:hypothetical protein